MTKTPKQSLLKTLAFSACFLSGLASSSALAQLPGGASEHSPTGPLVVSSNTTLQLPEDGVLAFTSITVNSSRRLTFSRPPSGKNPPVYLLSTGPIVIRGTIDVGPSISRPVFEGGPGGFDGGRQGSGGGHEPGRGPGGGFGHASHLTGAKAYGSPLVIPLIGGSGGAGSSSSDGGGGGGAIVIASDVSIDVNGASFYANGGNVGGFDGSGGVIRFVAPTVSGSPGIAQADGGSGGDGRFRIDAASNLVNTNAFSFGELTSGSNLFVTIPNPPTLTLVEVAGQSTSGAVTSMVLPFGAAAAQPVVVRASNIPTTQRVVVSVGCTGGTETITEVPFNLAGSWPQELTVTPTFPGNVKCIVQTYSEEVQP